MKSPFALLLGATLAGNAEGLRAELSPISRVVELLKGLAETAEKEGKKEEDLYETYVCWAKTVIDTKTATNGEAQARVDELNAYIADLDSGRIELTTERVDLEKEIKSLNQELEALEAQRKQEKEDFDAAKEEMELTIEALGEAIDVMESATGGGGFMQVKAGLGEGFSDRVKAANMLQKATELGEKFLSKGDALFLTRVLGGEVPKADWKKLNRKADFKMAYKHRSGHIQDVLKKMKSTFESNLADAEAKEEKAIEDYTELKEAKTEQLTTAEDALNKQDGENGAKALSKEDSETERDALVTQINNDKGFIEATANDLATKKAEWKDRQELRAGEIEAINKAIAILHSDDARDMFKSSFKSQSFMQLSSSSKKVRAADVLASAAKRSGDKRLAALAESMQTPNESMATGSHFDEVIAAIDDMVSTLKGEEETDLENKETCEKDRADDTRTAIKAARTMDERSDTVDELTTDIAEIVKTIAENEAEIKSIQEELAKATTMRGDEHTEWEAANRDDGAAAELVMRAKDVLAGFYEENNLNLLQKNKKMDPVVAGEAPPPPPATWEAPYGGKTGESQGIVAILEMIHEDILKDQTKSKADEDKAEQTFQDFKTNSETQIQSLEDANSDLTDTKGQKESDISTAKEQRGAKHDELNAVIAKINDATPSCVYTTINYPVRLKNRQVEIDGLEKAKAILQGGEFPSLLQRK
jgi:peptidoglycan hydrolase CwlO-like protein